MRITYGVQRFPWGRVVADKMHYSTEWIRNDVLRANQPRFFG